MKKDVKIKKAILPNPGSKVAKAEEPPLLYTKSVKVFPATKEFTYTEFKKIADKAPFSQAEWARMLHISERTLQRYAKNNGAFASINAERAMQIAKVIKRGKEVFGDINKFYRWIKSNPSMLEGQLSFESLTSYEGISMILIELGRIEHGILS